MEKGYVTAGTIAIAAIYQGNWSEPSGFPLSEMVALKKIANPAIAAVTNAIRESATISMWRCSSSSDDIFDGPTRDGDPETGNDDRWDYDRNRKSYGEDVGVLRCTPKNKGYRDPCDCR